tara:strand:- start:176 stop:478 length:303 start_codon:yes stop_codon:yes gene_type:complete
MTTETKPIIWFDGRESTRQLPPECITECSGSGDQYDTVKWWVEKLNFDGPVDLFKEHLDDYGCWDDEQLKDHEENKIKVLWLWACSCADFPETNDYLYLG